MKSGRGRGKSRSHHPYKCPFCTKRFEKPSQLQRHLRVHTGIYWFTNNYILLNLSRSVCYIVCQISRHAPSTRSRTIDLTIIISLLFLGLWASQNYLNQSNFGVLGERPYECNVCKKTFTQKGALQLHERTHTELRPYKCTHCPMRFSQKGNLRAHTNVCIYPKFCTNSKKYI